MTITLCTGNPERKTQGGIDWIAFVVLLLSTLQNISSLKYSYNSTNQFIIIIINFITTYFSK